MFTALLVITSLALGQTPAADAAAGAELKSKVDKLVQQLNSNEATRREAAEKELIALGQDVLPLLPATGPRTPAEVLIRLTRIRKALQKIEVESATRASVVSLAGEMTVSQAMAELTRQTGNKLVDYRERFNQEVSDPKIKVALEKVSFWQALDTILDAASLTLYNYDDEKGALAYTVRGDNAAQRLGGASYSGLFRLEPVKIEATRDLKSSMLHSLRLTVDAAWEPRVRPIVLEVPLAEASAKDEAGNEIGIDRTEATLEVPVEGNNAAVEIELPLTAPPWSVKTIASIKGKIMAVVLGKIESFEFADFDKNKQLELERGGATVIVESCRKNGDIYDVSMRVRFDRAANALESHRGWVLENECYLIDPKGNRKGNDGYDATLLAANEIGVAYKFDLGEKTTPAGYKLVYRTAAAIIKIPVDFELKNIERP